MLINLKNIQKTYITKTGVSFRAISNISLSFDESGLVFLLGKSGSGKTTLLNLIGGLDSIDSGAIHIGGKNLARLATSEVDSFRNTMVGFVFQEFNLIDFMTVYQNVKLALDMQSGYDDSLIKEAIAKVDLTDKMHEKVQNLSGGQRQRVGIARAIVKNPDIILADEPTGALDFQTGEEMMQIFKKLSKDKLIIMVSHDAEKAATYADRIVEMRDGRVYRDVRRKKAGEKIDYDQIHVTSDTLIRLEKGVTLKDADAEKINKIIKERGRKTFINVDSNPKKIKALFPNLREAVDSSPAEIKETLEISGNKTSDAQGNDNQDVKDADNLNSKDLTNNEMQTVKENFVPYIPPNDKIKEVTFKKSKLPTSNALRIGFKNLNLKLVKMVFTILIAVFALVMFGASMSFTDYNLNKAYHTTIKEDGYKAVVIKNAADPNYRLKDSEIEALKAANPRIEVFKQHNLSFYADMPYNQNYFYFNSFIETDDATNLYLDMLCGSSTFDAYNTVVISQVAAREYIKYGGFSGISDYADLIGKTITLRTHLYSYSENLTELKIGGIFKSDLSRYVNDSHNNRLYTDIQNGIEGILITKVGFKEAFIKTAMPSMYLDLSASYPGFETNYSTNFQIISNTSPLINEYELGINFNTTTADYDEWDFETEEMIYHRSQIYYDNYELSPGEIFISEQALSALNLYIPHPYWNNDYQTTVDDFNEIDSKIMVLESSNKPVYLTTNITVKGTIKFDYYYHNNVMIVDEGTYNQIANQSIYSNRAMLKLSGSNKADAKLIRYLSNNGFEIDNDFVNSYHSLLAVMSVLQKVIIVFALLLCLLVVVLLFTFISSSIKLTKKQIGILRALGARRIDTFKIYALEGIFIGTLSFVISCVLLLLFAPILNIVISATAGFYFAVFSIGIKDILSMLLLMTAVTAISIVIPIRKFNKITPIKAIVEKE